jgi:Fe-S cluster biogenesis protein NfuA
MSEVLIRIQETPNPNAWKFVLDRPVLLEGKATYTSETEAAGNRLAMELLRLNGVKQVHFFQNVITLTLSLEAETEEVHSNAIAVIQTRMPTHDPKFGIIESIKELRKNLSPELQKIEEILDRTIRPGLQGDGGDIEVLEYKDNKLTIHYQGACGTCPSSTQGTLSAIEGILRDEFHPEIEVFPV